MGLLPKAGRRDGLGFEDLLSRLWWSLHANQQTVDCLHMFH